MRRIAYCMTAIALLAVLMTGFASASGDAEGPAKSFFKDRQPVEPSLPGLFSSLQGDVYYGQDRAFSVTVPYALGPTDVKVSQSPAGEIMVIQAEDNISAIIVTRTSLRWLTAESFPDTNLRTHAEEINSLLDEDFTGEFSSISGPYQLKHPDMTEAYQINMVSQSYGQEVTYYVSYLINEDHFYTVAAGTVDKDYENDIKDIVKSLQEY